MNRNAGIELGNIQILVQVGPEPGARSSCWVGSLPDASVIANVHCAAVGAKSDGVHVHVDRVSGAIYIITRDLRPGVAAVRRANKRVNHLVATGGTAEKHVIGTGGAND